MPVCERLQVVQIFTGGADNSQGLFYPSGMNTSKNFNGSTTTSGLRVPSFTTNVSPIHWCPARYMPRPSALICPCLSLPAKPNV